MPFNPFLHRREGWVPTYIYNEVPCEQGRDIIGFVRTPDTRVFYALSRALALGTYFSECERETLEEMIADGVIRPVASFDEAQQLLQQCSRSWSAFPFHIFPHYDETVRGLFR